MKVIGGSTCEVQKKRISIVGSYYAVWNQYVGAYFIMLLCRSIYRKTIPNGMVSDTVFLCGSISGIPEYICYGKENLSAKE